MQIYYERDICMSKLTEKEVRKEYKEHRKDKAFA